MNKRWTRVIATIMTAVLLGSASLLVYSRWLRSNLLPAEFGYLPPNVNVIFATGDVGALWDAVDFHFGRVLADSSRESALRDTLAKLGEGLGVKTRLDLTCGHGLDVKRGLLFGAATAIHSLDPDHLTEGLSFVALLPIAADTAMAACTTSSDASTTDTDESDLGCAKLTKSEGRPESEAKLARFVCDQWEGFNGTVEPKLAAEAFACDVQWSALPAAGKWPAREHSYDMGDGLWMVVAEPGLAFISNSCDLLKRGLTRRTENLAYLRADDSLFEAARQQHWQLLRGPEVMVYLREVIADITPPVTVAASLNFTAEDIFLHVLLQASGSRARLVEEILAPHPRGTSWTTFVSEDTPVVLTVRDKAIPHYLRLVDQIPGFSDRIGDFLNGVLRQAQSVTQLDEFVVAATGYKEGVPTFLLGLWGKPDELTGLVLAMQQHLRDARDQEVLRGALAAQRKANPTVTMTEVLDSNELASEGKWLDRYRSAGDRLQAPPQDAAAFASTDYTEKYNGRDLKYLEPTLTMADVLYRLNNVEEPQQQVLLENRYRLASTIIGNTLWLSTGPTDLRTLLDRSSRPPDTAGARVDLNTKAQVHARTDRIIAESLLKGESTETAVLDLRYHERITFTLEPVRGKQAVRLELTAHGPSAPPNKIVPLVTARDP